MRILGIDPGLAGGIALLDRSRILNMWAMPVMGTGKKGRKIVDAAALTALIFANDISLCYLEEPSVGPVQDDAAGKRRGMGPHSAFSFGRGFGIIEGVICATHTPYKLVRPGSWSKKMMADIPQGDTKEVRMALACKRLYPGVDFRKSERCKNAHSGLTAATLIARYGLMMEAVPA